MGREDSSSSDEAGFVSPLASPHHVAPHRSLKEEIEREKELEREREEDAQRRREESAEEEAEKREIEAAAQIGGTTSHNTQKRDRGTVGESSEDLGISLDDVRNTNCAIVPFSKHHNQIDFDHPFPELDYNLRQPFDPENSTAYKLLHLRFAYIFNL